MTESEIPYIPLMMSHDDVANAPGLAFPAGYSIRLFQPGDERNWAEITADAEEFPTTGEALDYFHGHFMVHEGKLPERCLLLQDTFGNIIGTATGWFMDEDNSVGRLHWVAIAKAHQGKGLCKPLVAAAMRLMGGLGHQKAMLTTQPKSWKGIKVYLHLGWKPYDNGAADFEKGWSLVKDLSRQFNPR